MSIRLLEVFHLEDLDRLRDALVSFFGVSANPTRWEQQLSSSSTELGGLAWAHVGLICRAKSFMFPFAESVLVAPALPDFVESVGVRVNKLLGSFYVLSLEARLKPVATAELLRLQSARYLGEIEFNSLFPWRARSDGYSMGYPAAQVEQAVKDYLKGCRAALERSLAPLLVGYFSREGRARRPALPAIELYRIDGLEPLGEGVREFEQRSRRWLGSFGFHLTGFDAFFANGVIISWPRAWRRYKENRIEVIVLTSDFVASLPEPPKREEDIPHAVRFYFEKRLEPLVDALGLLSYLLSAESLVGELRQRVGRLGSSSWLGKGHSLRRLMRQSRQLGEEIARLDRLAIDFKTNEPLVEHRFAGELASFRILRPNSEGNLAAGIVTKAKNSMEELRSQFAQLHQTMERRLALRNMELLYRLQRRILWLTFIAAAATAVGLLAIDEKVWAKLERAASWIQRYLT